MKNIPRQLKTMETLTPATTRTNIFKLKKK